MLIFIFCSRRWSSECLRRKIVVEHCWKVLDGISCNKSCLSHAFASIWSQLETEIFNFNVFFSYFDLPPEMHVPVDRLGTVKKPWIIHFFVSPDETMTISHFVGCRKKFFSFRFSGWWGFQEKNGGLFCHPEPLTLQHEVIVENDS